MSHGLSKYGAPRTDVTSQLFLLLARDILSDAQADKAGKLVSEISDWNEFLSLSKRNAGLPFVYKHISHHLRDKLPASEMSEIKSLALRQMLASMKLTTALAAFHRDCLDVLVAERDFTRVAKLALSHNYRFLFQTEDGNFATSDQDIDFIMRHADCVSAFNADGVHFEIHRHIEKTTPIFPVDIILNATELVKVGKQGVKTMSIAWHFIYITYHHSRHFWSRLHWVADLHALRQHENFDITQVRNLARQIGILPTVEAALAFAELTDKPEQWADVLGKTPGGIFLDACLRGLPGDHAFELESWDAMFLFDFGDEWQFDKKKKYSFWAQSAMRRIRPNEFQYKEKPRTKSLEWLYIVENMATLSGNLFKRFGT